MCWGLWTPQGGRPQLPHEETHRGLWLHPAGGAGAEGAFQALPDSLVNLSPWLPSTDRWETSLSFPVGSTENMGKADPLSLKQECGVPARTHTLNRTSFDLYNSLVKQSGQMLSSQFTADQTEAQIS